MKTINHKNNLFLTLLLIVVTSNICIAQQYYVNTSPWIGGVDNKTYLFTIDSCSKLTDTTTLPMFTCYSKTPYSDIAVDNKGYLWYAGDTIVNSTVYNALYKMRLSDSSCSFVVQFPYWGINSLVADTIGNIYATGGLGGWLFKYDGNNLKVIDTLPSHMRPAGDMFFYNNRLFVTCHNKNFDSSYLAEFNVNYTRHSCYYMPLPDMRPYAAFTIRKEGFPTRVFILTVDTPGYSSSKLVEIDIPNKKILNTICTYPFTARGAASYYPAVWDSTSCPKPTSVGEYDKRNSYCKVLNPSTNTIRLNTNLASEDISKVSLYSLSGILIKKYSKEQFPENMDISTVPEGLYILQLRFANGVVINEKVLKGN